MYSNKHAVLYTSVKKLRRKDMHFLLVVMAVKFFLRNQKAVLANQYNISCILASIELCYRVLNGIM